MCIMIHFEMQDEDLRHSNRGFFQFSCNKYNCIFCEGTQTSDSVQVMQVCKLINYCIINFFIYTVPSSLLQIVIYNHIKTLHQNFLNIFYSEALIMQVLKQRSSQAFFSPISSAVLIILIFKISKSLYFNRKKNVEL